MSRTNLIVGAMVAAVAVVGLTVAGIWWLGGDDDPTERGATLDEVVSDPEAYDEGVTLRAPVGAVLGPNAFILGGEQIGEAGALVVLATERATVPGGLAAGDFVRVTGNVEIFDERPRDDELLRDVPSGLADRLADQPALVANVVDEWDAG